MNSNQEQQPLEILNVPVTNLTGWYSLINRLAELFQLPPTTIVGSG